MQVAECHQEAGLDLRCTNLKFLRRLALRNGPIASAKRSQVHQDNCHGAAASACQVVLETVPQALAKRRKKAKAPRYFQWEEELELAFERTSKTAPADVRILGNDPVALARVGIGLADRSKQHQNAGFVGWAGTPGQGTRTTGCARRLGALTRRLWVSVSADRFERDFTNRFAGQAKIS